MNNQNNIRMYKATALVLLVFALIGLAGCDDIDRTWTVTEYTSESKDHHPVDADGNMYVHLKIGSTFTLQKAVGRDNAFRIKAAADVWPSSDEWLEKEFEKVESSMCAPIGAIFYFRDVCKKYDSYVANIVLSHAAGSSEDHDEHPTDPVHVILLTHYPENEGKRCGEEAKSCIGISVACISEENSICSAGYQKVLAAFAGKNVGSDRAAAAGILRDFELVPVHRGSGHAGGN